MPAVDFIDVRITSNSQPLQEFPDPNNDTDDAHKRVRYIESLVGQKFSVKIQLLPGFKLNHAQYFASEFTIDNNITRHLCSDTINGLKHRKGLIQDVLLHTETGHLPIWNDAFGRWDNCAFQFGALGTNEEVPDATKRREQDVSQLGSIRVKVFRAREQAKKQPYTWDGLVDKPVDELPERVLKGRDIKTNTKYAPDGLGTPQPTVYHDYVPMEGPHGVTYEFIFKYRARKALQNLEVLERSPSPEPDPRAMLARAEDMNRHLLDELAKFKNGSVQTEGSTTVYGRSATPQLKQERQFPRPFPTPVSDGPASSRKRDRDEFEDDDDVIETGPLPKVPRIEIDLTGDDD